MSDKPVIMAGLAVFVVLATFPIWYKLVAGEGVPQPDREYPKNVPRCVEEGEWMVSNHMNLLRQWRDEVVRGDGQKKPYKSRDFGAEHLKSLTRTCMECHSRKDMCDTNGDTSCTQCHNYANVEPECWDCHIELKGN
jgi:hypothetical protein